MLMKIAIIALAGAALAAFILRGRPSGGAGGGVPRRSRVPARAETLNACPRCGAYRAAGSLCDCERAPTL